MKIYLDLILLLNFGLDFILLLVVSIILKRNVSIKRLVLGALIGSLSILMLFIKINSITLMIGKVLVSLLMIVISFGYRDLKYFGNNLFYLYMTSIVLGGFLYLINDSLAYRNVGIIFVHKGLSINFILMFIAIPILFYLYIRNIRLLKNNYSNYYDCKIFFDKEHWINVKGFYDTGNKLKDPYSGKGIILLNKKYIPKVIRSPILIPYNSLNNHGLLKCFRGYEIFVDDKVFKDFLIGISDQELYLDGIDCILSDRIMEGLR